MERNQLILMKENTFKGLKSVTTLILTSNNPANLPSGLFKDLSNLVLKIINGLFSLRLIGSVMYDATWDLVTHARLSQFLEQ